MAPDGSGASVAIPAAGLRLNVGCGSRTLDGWFNCDIERNPDAPRDPDLLCDARAIPLPDGCASVVMAIHIFEHVHKWEAGELLAEWRRLLRPGGQLVLELPDLLKCCQNVVDGLVKGGKHPDQLGMWGIYGDDRTKNPYMAHKYGWTPKTLEAFLKEHGFSKVRHMQTVFHPAGRHHRDMRIEATR
jgi:ubiquinone/menaquinone biosynthesis C-methylase UbiE